MGNGCITCAAKVEADESSLMERFKSGQIERKFTETYTQAPSLQFNEDARLIIFSDIHRGNGDAKTDLSLKSEPTYRQALHYYYQQGYHLVHNGDIEDAWMHPDVSRILSAHKDIYQEERKFHQEGRYIRLVGNHDDVWVDVEQVQKHLEPIFPQLQIYNGLRLNFLKTSFFILHGHQGSYDVGTTDENCAKCCVRYGVTPCMECCNTDKTGYQVPSKNDRLANQLDFIANSWSQEHKVRLIMSHTHAPVLHDFNNKTYWNTGCCCYSDGSITGLEATATTVSLIRFSPGQTTPKIIGMVPLP